MDLMVLMPFFSVNLFDRKICTYNIDVNQKRKIAMKEQLGTCIESLYKCKFDLMHAIIQKMSVEIKTLSSIVKRSICKGYNHYNESAKGIPLITAESIKSLKYTADHIFRVSCDGCSITECVVSGGDIVFVLEGEHAGTSAIIPVFSEGGVVDHVCAGISVNSEIADPFYIVNVLHYWYRSGFFSDVVRSKGKISIANLESLKIPLPDIEFQKMISTALLEISGMIERMYTIANYMA